jgi:hypothetical protein
MRENGSSQVEKRKSEKKQGWAKIATLGIRKVMDHMGEGSEGYTFMSKH